MHDSAQFIQGIPKDNPTFCGIDFRSNQKVATNYSGQYSTHVFTDRAIDIIKQHVQQTAEEKVC
jgi:hypothetical protein